MTRGKKSMTTQPRHLPITFGQRGEVSVVDAELERQNRKPATDRETLCSRHGPGICPNVARFTSSATVGAEHIELHNIQIED